MTSRSPDRSTGRGPRPRARFAVLLTSAIGLAGAVAWSGLGTESVASALVPAGERAANPDPFAAIAAATLVPRAPQQIMSEAYLVAARESGHSRIWAHMVGSAQPARLTAGSWDDRDPAVSPTQEYLAFSSNRDGNWELYLFRLSDGSTQRLTETPGYEGNPTWSPDGLWLAFEAYYDGNFDIWILPIDGSQAPIQLTDHPAADLSPTWDPGGRRIAFTSDREGESEIYIADLDQPSNRFRNLTRTAGQSEADPAFSPDGQQLAYTVMVDGVRGVQRLPLYQTGARPEWVGQGTQPAWSADGTSISVILQTPYSDHVVDYHLQGGVTPPNGTLAGAISELQRSWVPAELTGIALAAPEEPLYEVVMDQSRAEGERLALIPLEGIRPEGSMLSDLADEAFLALRDRAAYAVGWDVLGSLQHAFVGLNDPLPPGYAYNDWLYTGRAFSINPSAVQAGWVEVVREEFGQHTYWRVYVRTLAQDGSQGAPMRHRPWDFAARFAGDPITYDSGGKLKDTIPDGYYLDLTTLAADFGFERLPALSNWRSFYPGARFDEFALRDSLDWVEAMAQLYPLSAISTPTPYQTPTPTPTNTPWPTPTPWWWRWRTPTPTPEFTPTASP